MNYAPPPHQVGQPPHMGHHGGPIEAFAPISFWEFLMWVYPPTHFLYNWQHYFCSIACGAAASATARNSGNLNIQVPIFAFSFRSVSVIHSTGQQNTSGQLYRIGLAQSSANDWTFGNWISQVVTGNGTTPDLPFAWPREVPASTQLTVTVDNSIYSANVALDVDAGLVGLEPRRREQPLMNGQEALR